MVDFEDLSKFDGSLSGFLEIIDIEVSHLNKSRNAIGFGDGADVNLKDVVNFLEFVLLREECDEFVADVHAMRFKQESLFEVINGICWVIDACFGEFRRLFPGNNFEADIFETFCLHREVAACERNIIELDGGIGSHAQRR